MRGMQRQVTIYDFLRLVKAMRYMLVDIQGICITLTAGESVARTQKNL